MKWEKGHVSSDVEDRRGRPAGGAGKKLGIGATVLGIVVMLVFGKDYLGVTQKAAPTSGATTSAAPDPAEEELKQFVSFVLDDLQTVWAAKFQALGLTYQKARLVLFTDAVDSACGTQSSAVGPFYCPGDSQVYIDLGFFRLLHERFGAPGDFAQAYVVAHEIGHHVQRQLGTNEKVARLTAQDPGRKNELSVRTELQADCLAGVYAHSTKKRDLLEQGDIEEGLKCASAIGDDTLQKQAGARVRPETFTHGSSAARKTWFERGLKSGDVGVCDTFAVPDI